MLVRVVAVVLIAELSGAITLVPVIALACAISTFVGNLFGLGGSCAITSLHDASRTAEAAGNFAVHYGPHLVPTCRHLRHVQSGQQDTDAFRSYN